MGRKVRISKQELEQLCLSELQKMGAFADASDVEVALLLGSRQANWTVRRLRRSGILRRPSGSTWEFVGRAAVDRLKRRWELRA